jgi:alpha-tubulin suppressor-like RCC1 family protein
MCDAAPRAPAETVDGGLRAPGRSPETARVRRGVRSWSITADGVRHATICIGPAQCGHASGSTFTALTARYQHTCGLTSAGTAYCWGDNSYGQIGDGTTTQRLTPVAVQGGLVFTALTGGGQHTCGRTSAGAAYCWGYNATGALGDGTSGPNRLTPVAVQGGLVFTALTAGFIHTCGLTSAGAAYCWGDNSYGQLGDGTGTYRLTPVAVQGGLVFTALTGGVSHTCGLTSAGAAYCWGWNGPGQLGDGTWGTNRLTPVAVLRP